MNTFLRCLFVAVTILLAGGCVSPDRNAPVGRDLSYEAEEERRTTLGPSPGCGEGSEPAWPRYP